VLTGRINSQREAVVQLWLKGPSGQVLQIEAIIDTGFTGFLSLPQSQVTRLGLIRQGRGEGVLADGTKTPFEVYEAIVLWRGEPRVVSVNAVETDPLLGMEMLYGSEVAMQVVEGGEVAIRELHLA
jgi:clan AA aspartic protease